MIPASYHGATTQAVIKCDNDTAVKIVRNAWEMSTKQEIVEVVDEVVAELFDLYPDIPAQLTSSCGDGSFANVQMQVDQAAGTFRGQIEFVNYCVNWEEQFDLNGIVTFSGTAKETSTAFIVTLITNFNNVAKKESDGPLVYTITEGNAVYIVTMDINGITENIKYDYVLRDNSVPSKTYWLDGLEITIFSETEESASEATFSGRFYDNDYGFVNIASEGPLYIPDIDIPTGILWFYGLNSKARLTFNEGSTLLEVDQNSDGTMDCSESDIFPTVLPLSITTEGIAQNRVMPGIKIEKFKLMFTDH